MRYVNGTRLDDRIVRTDWDAGFKEGRQYGRGKTGGQVRVHVVRTVEIPCPTCPTWSHFIQDKLKISIYLSLDKYKCIKLTQFCTLYFD